MIRSIGYWCGFVSSLALLAPDAVAQAAATVQTSPAQTPQPKVLSPTDK